MQFAVKNRQSNLEDPFKFCPVCGKAIYHYKHIAKCAEEKGLDGGKAEAFSRGCFKSGMRGPLPLSVKDELYAAALESKEAFFTSLDHLFKQTGVGLDSAANSQ